MSNPILSALLKSLGGAVVNAAKLGVLPGIGHTVSGRKKAGNCTPCAARARVEAARRAARGEK
jgi:hypothetical protein